MTLNGQNPRVPLEQAQEEFRAFYRVLQSYGVEVASPAPVPKLFDQIFTRDIAGVIGRFMIPANMSTSARSREPKALASLLGSLHREHVGSIKVAPLRDPESGERIYFEFGDIFPHGDKLFIGKSERTNWAAIRWFEREFSNSFQVVPVELVKPSETQEALHLDCAFNLVGSHNNPIVLLHRASLVDPDKLLRSLPMASRIIEVSDSDQENFATNVLSIDDKTVVIRDLCARTADQLEKLGLTTHRLPFNAAAALGGLFRCCSMPLYRDNSN